jgi:hypothetical protein
MEHGIDHIYTDFNIYTTGSFSTQISCILQYLVVHLKRFKYENARCREKVETLVNFPLVGMELGNTIYFLLLAPSS